MLRIQNDHDNQKNEVKYITVFSYYLLEIPLASNQIKEQEDQICI